MAEGITIGSMKLTTLLFIVLLVLIGFGAYLNYRRFKAEGHKL